MLKVIGAGLPRTGTKSLCEALKILGYTAIHYAGDRLPIFPEEQTNWRCFDDIDAITDYPASWYWRELHAAYPNAKVVLTTRDEASWWASIRQHVVTTRVQGTPQATMLSDAMHSVKFGWPKPCEYWYVRRFREHNEAVIRETNPLVFDVQD